MTVSGGEVRAVARGDALDAEKSPVVAQITGPDAELALPRARSRSRRAEIPKPSREVALLAAELPVAPAKKWRPRRRAPPPPLARGADLAPTLRLHQFTRTEPPGSLAPWSDFRRSDLRGEEKCEFGKEKWGTSSWGRHGSPSK